MKHDEPEKRCRAAFPCEFVREVQAETLIPALAWAAAAS